MGKLYKCLYRYRCFPNIPTPKRELLYNGPLVLQSLHQALQEEVHEKRRLCHEQKECIKEARSVILSEKVRESLILTIQLVHARGKHMVFPTCCHCALKQRPVYAKREGNDGHASVTGRPVWTP